MVVVVVIGRLLVMGSSVPLTGGGGSPWMGLADPLFGLSVALLAFVAPATLKILSSAMPAVAVISALGLGTKCITCRDSMGAEIIAPLVLLFLSAAGLCGSNSQSALGRSARIIAQFLSVGVLLAGAALLVSAPKFCPWCVLAKCTCISYLSTNYIHESYSSLWLKSFCLLGGSMVGLPPGK